METKTCEPAAFNTLGPHSSSTSPCDLGASTPSTVLSVPDGLQEPTGQATTSPASNHILITTLLVAPAIRRLWSTTLSNNASYHPNSITWPGIGVSVRTRRSTEFSIHGHTIVPGVLRHHTKHRFSELHPPSKYAPGLTHTPTSKKG